MDNDKFPCQVLLFRRPGRWVRGGQFDVNTSGDWSRFVLSALLVRVQLNEDAVKVRTSADRIFIFAQSPSTPAYQDVRPVDSARSPARSDQCRIAVLVLLATALYPVIAAMLVNGPISPLGGDDADAAPVRPHSPPANTGAVYCTHRTGDRPNPKTDTNRTKTDRGCIAEVPPLVGYWE
ncbi:hypothetical protein [Nocardia sp. NPDC057440]|uniref:hypothetical protein n=1 Tax=Nocardia sp. NPDC057440 TaxID=3346134 RepID=UPI0036724B4C